MVSICLSIDIILLTDLFPRREAWDEESKHLVQHIEHKECQKRIDSPQHVFVPLSLLLDHGQ